MPKTARGVMRLLEWVSEMSSLLQFPTELPWWATLAILVPVVIYALLLLAMPFSVFGLKSRLDQIEGKLDDVADELRALTARLPARPVATPATSMFRDHLPQTTSLSDAAEMAASMRPLRTAADSDLATRPRAEPRLDWRR